MTNPDQSPLADEADHYLRNFAGDRRAFDLMTKMVAALRTSLASPPSVPEGALEPATAGDGYHYSDRSPAVPVVEREAIKRILFSSHCSSLSSDEATDAILALIEQPAFRCRNCGDPISDGVLCG